MLNRNDITSLYQDGPAVKLRRKAHPKNLKGDMDIVSEYELGITLLHEFIHARDDRKGRQDTEDDCVRVEQEARQTFDRRPHLLDIIRDLYNIDSLKIHKNMATAARRAD